VSMTPGINFIPGVLVTYFLVIAGAIETSSKFIARVVDTGKQLSAVTTTQRIQDTGIQDTKGGRIFDCPSSDTNADLMTVSADHYHEFEKRHNHFID
jgi:hypothetical protein